MKNTGNTTKKAMRLYAVTDRSWLCGRSLAQVVEESLKGGVTFLQIREKNLEEQSFEEEAIQLKKLAKDYKVPFVVNDNVNLAKKIDADGVHIGQSDAELKEARRMLGPDKIIGVSAHNVQEAIEAEKGGADYLGVGAVFTTSTKKDADAVPFEVLQEICSKVSIPVVAIGGINRDNVCELKGSGIDGIAVVSAIYAAENIELASKELLSLVKEMIEE